MDFKNFRIPNRDVKVTYFEAAITRTRAFQRLFYLKQLGLAHVVYPCATHTRAGHSIECLDEATKLLASIGVQMTDDSWRDVRLAALLHDMGHIPFSHILEDENQVLPKHDKGERVERVLSKLKAELPGTDGDAVDRAKSILLAIAANDDNQQDWRSDLVGNTVCADLLAYITTDAAWTGIEKRPGYYRVYDYFERRKKRLSSGRDSERLCIRLTKGGLRTDIVSAILDLLDMRYSLTERVIFHHAKAVASAMLARAARLVKISDEPQLLDMGDECFLDYLEKRAKGLSPELDAQGAGMLLDHLRSRRLYKRVFKVQRQAMEDWDRTNSRADGDTFCTRWRGAESVETMLNRVEDRFNLPRGTLVLWCPDVKSGMKLVHVNVTWEQAGGWHNPVELRSDDVKQQFQGVHDRVATIEKQYLDLWTLWVGMHPDHLKQAPAVIDALSNEFQIACDPVFIETYAKTRLPGFAKAAKIYGTLQDTLRTDYLPDVDARLQAIAAREETEVDAAVVGEAIHSVSSEKRTPDTRKTKRREQDQPGLFGSDQPDRKKADE